MKLSKEFNTVNYELLVVELNIYWFSKKTLKLIFRHLNNRTKRFKINKTFSSCRELLYGLPHGSVLGSIIFNVHLNYVFLFLNEIDVCNFDNNTTPSMCHKNLAELLEKRERNSKLTIHWVEDNYMNLNAIKCHLLISGH